MHIDVRLSNEHYMLDGATIDNLSFKLEKDFVNKRQFVIRD